MNNEINLPSNPQVFPPEEDTKKDVEVKKLDYTGQITSYTEPGHPSRPYQVFTENSLITLPAAKVSVSYIISKAILLSILAIPVIMLAISVYTYLYNNEFDLMVLGDYPRWLSSQIEIFVKTNIVPLLNQ